MARKTGQIIRRGSSTWLVRIYVGRTPETRRPSSSQNAGGLGGIDARNARSSSAGV